MLFLIHNDSQLEIFKLSIIECNLLFLCYMFLCFLVITCFYVFKLEKRAKHIFFYSIAGFFKKMDAPNDQREIQQEQGGENPNVEQENINVELDANVRSLRMLSRELHNTTEPSQMSLEILFESIASYITNVQGKMIGMHEYRERMRQMYTN